MKYPPIVFEDLYFVEHPQFPWVSRAVMTISSKYSVSILTGDQTWSSKTDRTYELAVLTADCSQILYNLKLHGADGRVLNTKDVLKYISPADVTAVIHQLQAEDQNG
jgi:hypothetical protein